MWSKSARILSTWFGSGYIKPAPGTWGTLAGIPVLFLPAYLLPIFIIFGWFCVKEEIKNTHDKDPSYIVIDEVMGLWVAFLFCVNTNFIQIFAAIVLFRFFDIIKPWPISIADKKVNGATGVILDDLIAGLFAGLLILLGRYFNVF